MQPELRSLQGLGKLSKSFLYRLVSKSVTGLDGQVYPGASKYELLAVIYLSQIADQKGLIKQFHLQDFAQVLKCSEREVYVLLNNLVSKKYISAHFYQNKKWTGFRNIRLIGNDFSKVKKYSRENRYLSTFYSFFNWSDGNVSSLEKLSLYALRLLLLLLFDYHYQNGANGSAAYYCERLQIKDTSLIDSYLKEIEDALLYEKFYEVKKSKKNKNGFIHIYSKNNFLIPENKPADTQMTFYKRKWLMFLLNHNAVLYNDPALLLHSASYKVDMHMVLNSIFSVVSAYLLKGYALECLETIIKGVIAESGYLLDFFLLAKIRARLQGELDFKPVTIS